MQSSSRNGAKVRLLAIHTTEGILRVNDLKNWKTWPGSSHATADQYGGFLDGPGDGFVAYDRASWTLRSGNAVSDNIELCGFAKWTRADWLARPKLLESAAVWLARRAAARPWIPLVKLSPAEVRAGKAGVIGHNDWTVGMKDGSHWDPGPGFPWELVLARANQLRSGSSSPITTLPVQEDDMPLTDADVRKILDWPFKTLADGRVLSLGQYLNALGGAVDVTKEAVDAVPAKVWAEPVPRPNAEPMPAGALLGWADRAASIAATAGSNPAAVAAELLPGLLAELKLEATVPDQMALEAALRGALRSLA